MSAANQQNTGEKQGGTANLTNAGKGRKPGTPNKVTKELKEMILQALDGAGGVEYLQEQADKNPKAFLSLVGRTLPLSLTGSLKLDLGEVINAARARAHG